MRNVTLRIGILAAVLLASGCRARMVDVPPPPPPPPPVVIEPPPPPPVPELPAPPIFIPETADPGPTLPPRGTQKTFETVTVFYGTTRNWHGDRRARAAYYGKDPTSLQYGTCQVSIPFSHTAGQRETPFIASVPFFNRFTYVFEDPNEHVVLLDVARLGEASFFHYLSQRIAASREKSAFVFVHGFNATFRDACRQVAQVAADIKFDGAPVLFSWPSDGVLKNYAADEEEMRDAERDLERFLWDVRQRTGAQAVHIFAHSLGSRGLLAALNKMAAERRPTGTLFDQIIMAAADIRVHSFNQSRAVLNQLANGTTLYISKNDVALNASRVVHAGHPRVGEVADPLVLFPGIDTIDASEVNFSLLGINHSYWSDKLQVLRDIADLMRRVPQLRPYLEERVTRGGKYWVLKAAR